MRLTFLILGIIAATLALILAVTPWSQLAFFPIFAALVFAAIAYYLAKRGQTSKKTADLVFLLAAIALVLTSYKAVFSDVSEANIEDLQLKEDATIEDSKEILKNSDLENKAPNTEDKKSEVNEREELRQMEGVEEQ